MNQIVSRKKGSSVPSDRIPPPVRSQAKNKGSGKQAEPLKSKEVRRLEGLRDALVGATLREPDPKGGCFCQAQMHVLSPYTPICQNCGLVLCELHLPLYACPHCKSPLLTPAARDGLVTMLETQITDTLAKEQDERERLLQEARVAAGAFPALTAAAAPPTDTLSSHPTNQTHKILSLNSKTKKVTVSSFTSPAKSRSASRDCAAKEADKEQARRVPPPPPEVEFVKAAPDPLRPWANLRGTSVTYVPAPKVMAILGPKSSSS
ncbi:hypothetical protein SCP_0900590 [Sparassis crispa]|uniref:TRIP4/RQT4 C2HC5-type zinc finger domain-containing protein n=1 Tax=Sparassis crispa TaxID=139825 RepID=A0A401GVC1_9APHY|nr:hypothetical protein SCP_0900590 [Sparassis crispa]GBE86181.1 hypothetical protein SCP_0900590 [Sparassis crispa]